ncbi:hypothetical protein AB0J72_29610 [Dactylosporangium sp. NPDC049742]|uniref:hypothetical protein n=1 Tax=Dactylosporangium sp. NPDC049742 TaxID=3154737 RepID=UPI00342028BB
MTNDNSSTWSNQAGAQAGNGGSVVGRDQYNNQRNTKKTQFGGLVAVVAVIVVAIVAILAGRAIYAKIQSSDLTAESTCAEFLQAPEDEERSAIRKIGIEKGVGGTGSPLALPAISYACSSHPDMRLGDVIVKFKGQF